jgi:hypothetical protein
MLHLLEVETGKAWQFSEIGKRYGEKYFHFFSGIKKFD